MRRARVVGAKLSTCARIRQHRLENHSVQSTARATGRSTGLTSTSPAQATLDDYCNILCPIPAIWTGQFTPHAALAGSRRPLRTSYHHQPASWLCCPALAVASLIFVTFSRKLLAKLHNSRISTYTMPSAVVLKRAPFVYPPALPSSYIVIRHQDFSTPHPCAYQRRHRASNLDHGCTLNRGRQDNPGTCIAYPCPPSMIPFQLPA